MVQALNVPEADRISRTYDGERMVGSLRCSLCLRVGTAGAHSHVQCQLVGTMDKIRAQSSLIAIKVAYGALERVDVEAEVDARKKFGEVEKRIAALESTVEWCKTQLGQKGGKQQQGKRKSEDGGAPPPSGSKKQKKGGQGGSKGQQGAASASGKGKAKA